MRALMFVSIVCLGCSQEQPVSTTQLTSPSIPRPAPVPEGSPDKDPLEKILQSGSVYRISEDRMGNDTCVQWFIAADEDHPFKHRESGRLFLSSVDPRGVTMTTLYRYRYSFVASSFVHEFLPGFDKALNSGMSFEEASQRYGRDLTRVWWMELSGPSVEMSAGPGGGSFGCTEGHPIRTGADGTISFGEDPWFLDEKSCQEALQDPRSPRSPLGC
jgi:hypothetical protein